MKFIFVTLTLLFASLYVHSENINSANADFCIDLEEFPKLLLVKRYINFKIQTGEKHVVCESPYRGFNVVGKIDFIDTSGKNTVNAWGLMDYGYITSCADCGGSTRRMSYPLPDEIQIDLPEEMYMKFSKISPKEKNDMFKTLLQFRDKLVDGNMDVLLHGCKPHKLEYNVKFRARIVGECGSVFLKEREDNYWEGYNEK